jgi:hypothetical protein
MHKDNINNNNNNINNNVLLLGAGRPPTIPKWPCSCWNTSGNVGKGLRVLPLGL